MKKKIVSVLLCATMVTGLAMGCGKSSDSSSEKTSDGKTKIRMTYWNNEDTVKTLLDYLEKEVPDVKIEFQFIDNSNYDTVVDTQLSAEEGPDIICESPASALKHAKLGYLEKVNDLGIGPGGLGGRVTAIGLNIETYPTHIAGLPVAVNICCHVNRHIQRIL